MKIESCKFICPDEFFCFTMECNEILVLLNVSITDSQTPSSSRQRIMCQENFVLVQKFSVCNSNSNK